MVVKNKVVVKILGQEYSLVSDDNREHMQRIANIVDDKMRELYNNNKKMSTSMVAVLTSLNMTDEYLKALDEQDNILKRFENPKNEIVELEDTLKKVKVALTATEMKCFDLEKENSTIVETLKNYENTLLDLRIELDNTSREYDESKRKLSNSELINSELKEEINRLNNELEKAKLDLNEFIDTFEK